MKRVFTWVGISAIVLSTMVLGASAGPLAEATSSALGGIEIGGFLDLSYMYNFNEPNPDPLFDSTNNRGRVFDVDHDDFVNVQLLQFYIDNLPQDVGEVGFRVDIGIGEDAELIGGDDPLLIDDNINVYQAFMSYIAPLGNGLTIDVGRFASWHGYESIESPYNDNFSRSFLFGYSIPLTHTGIRLTYPINDCWEVSGGVTQGWDTVDDNNDGKSFHLAVRFMPNEQWFFQNAVSYGPEQDDIFSGADGDYTFLYDFIANWNATEDWSFGLNFNYAQEENVFSTSDDVEWWGVAGYARYDVTEDFYVAVRGEWFDDNDGYRTPQPFIGESDELWEITLTAGYQIAEDLLGRIEYRHDDAREDIFWDGSKLDDTQDTIAVELIYMF